MLGKLLSRWIRRTVEKEAGDFLQRLRAGDPEFLGTALAMSTHIRHDLEDLWGWDLLRPRTVLEKDPTASLKVSQLIKIKQRAGDLPNAGALMVWGHTLRAAGANASEEQKRIVNEIWERLHFGDAYVTQAATDLMIVSKAYVRTEGYQLTPNGFTIESRTPHPDSKRSVYSIS